MDVTSLLGMLRTAAQGGSASASGVTLTEGRKLDPADPPREIENAVDAYLGSQDTPPSPIGQNGATVYAQALNPGLPADVDLKFFDLITNGIGLPSGQLHQAYEAAIAKLSPTLRNKDWSFSVSDGQLVFKQGHDALTADDRIALTRAFANAHVAVSAVQVANATVQAIELDRRMGYQPKTSTGMGQYDVTTSNFSDIVNLRQYMTSITPVGMDYDAAFWLVGTRLLLEQISAKAVPKYAGPD